MRTWPAISGAAALLVAMATMTVARADDVLKICLDENLPPLSVHHRGAPDRGFDVTLAQADAKIDCQGGSSSTGTWVTGGGWIVGLGGGKATFGFVAGTDLQNNMHGHFVLVDHNTGQIIQGDNISGFTQCTSGVSHFDGNDPNGSSTFHVDTSDVAEPGRGQDTLSVSGTDTTGVPYANGPQTLGEGNVQDHGFTCP